MTYFPAGADSAYAVGVDLDTRTADTLVGFGRGKGVCLSVRDAAGMHLARVRLR